MSFIDKYGKELATILMSTGLMSTFIIIFFFTYVSRVEHHMVENEIMRLATVISNYVSLLNENDLTNISITIDDTIATLKNNEKIKNDDKKVKEHNYKLFMKALTACIPLTILCFIVTYLLYKKSNFKINEVILVNMITLGAVVLVEIVFTSFIIGKFMPLDINNIKLTFINELYKK